MIADIVVRLGLIRRAEREEFEMGEEESNGVEREQEQCLLGAIREFFQQPSPTVIGASRPIAQFRRRNILP